VNLVFIFLKEKAYFVKISLYFVLNNAHFDLNRFILF